MTARPNIFAIATRELSQDGFFTWLLKWADSSNAIYNKELNALAKRFVRLLIAQKGDGSLQIQKVIAERQQEGIDIVAHVNDDHILIIEDKVSSQEHSDQLDRYKKIAIEKYKGKNVKRSFIYLKTGNESLARLSKIEEKGYSIVGRKELLGIFSQQRTKNGVFEDFHEYLESIEEATNSFRVFKNVTSDHWAAEGLFLALQEFNLSRFSAAKIHDWVSEIGDWTYVANQSGGFLGFWYHWNETSKFEIYIQIENAYDNGIKLVIKIGDWKPNTELLYRVLSDLQPIAIRHGLSLSKPSRFKAGDTSTAAMVADAFPVDTEGVLDFDKLTKELIALEKTIDEYCRSKN